MEDSPLKEKNIEEEIDSNEEVKEFEESEESENTLIEEKIINSNDDIEIVKYSKGRFLGEGAFAKCYELTCLENNKLFAAKIIPKSLLGKSKSKEKLIKEIKIHKFLKYINIVNFDHYFEDNKNIYILLELCQNKTLRELLKKRAKLTELEVQYYLIQLIKALKYLHSKKIIHRDLKLSNIFLTEKMELKLGDFGLSVKLDFDSEKRNSICGTPNYIAPEILNKKSYQYEVDIWSLGIIIYTLLIGKNPFNSKEVKNIYKKIKNLDYSFPEDCTISKEAKNLIEQILVLDPSERINLEQIMNHDFFKLGNNIPKLLPTSTLYSKPNIDYIRQFMPEADENGVVNKKIKTNNNLKNYFELEKEDEILFKGKEYNYDDEEKIKKPNIWVKCWIDYSSRFGIGYVLNNGNFGAFLNDKTKIIFNPESNIFFYIERKLNNKPQIYSKYNLDNYPKEIKNKVSILIYFKKILEDDMNNKFKYYFENENEKKYEEKIKKQNELEEKNNIKNNIEKEEPFIFVRIVMKLKYANIFLLSNMTMQIIYPDYEEVILFQKSWIATYINKNRERKTYPLGYAIEYSENEMKNKVDYCRNIYFYLLSDRTCPEILENYKGAKKPEIDINQVKEEEKENKIKNEKEETKKKEEEKEKEEK